MTAKQIKVTQKKQQAQEPYGVVVAPDTVRFERLLPGPIERIWAYLTDSEKRGKWLASGPMELREGGRVELRFHHADLSAEKSAPPKFKKYEGGVTGIERIIRCEPPRLLTFTWGSESADASEVTFELTPRGKDVLLVLTHRRLPNRKEMRGVAGGWHAHLGILIDQLNGREPRPFWTTHGHLEKEYAKRIGAQHRPARAKASEIKKRGSR